MSSLISIFVRPAEFFLTMLGGNNIAPTYGRHRLKGYFGELAATDNE